MARLSAPVENIKGHYTIVVIGSGYGGGIAASRMARAGQQVCVLERGKEFQPGEYPDTQFEATREMQTDLPAFHTGSRTGLYDLRVNEDINVFLGCGLGGTSLVNANVALRAEARVFDDPRWPRAVRDDMNTLVEEGYRRAEEMLKPTPYPDSFPQLPKLLALQKSASHLGEKFYRPPINVTFEDGVNHVGVSQQACKLCGDCCSGCNFAAKNTTLMNYLPDAWNHGAEIYTQVSVRYLERAGDLWRVHYEMLGAGRERFDSPTMFMTANLVVLAAGTLGSTEILLRSQEEGLILSPKLGHGFTGNGDVLAFGYNCDQLINGIGVGQNENGMNLEEVEEPVGPCITGIIDLREREELDRGMVIEEGAIPSPLGRLLAPSFALASGLLGADTDIGAEDSKRERVRELHSLVRGPYHGAVHNTQTYLVMTHDDSAGRMYLDDDRLRIEWPGVGKQPIFTQVNERLEEATRALGGTYLKNPLWTEWARHDLVTVHPLGGCAMAESAEAGVVNHKGQVFSGQNGDGVYEGLYVCDGSVVPRSLGVNPLLTISALAERACALMARDRRWEIDYTLPSAPGRNYAQAPLGIQFTESMKGFFSTTVTDDYQRGWEQGKRDGSRFEFNLTIISDDLERTLNDAEHSANIVGTVLAPALSAKPLTITGGEFNLFVKDPDAANTRKMRYRMIMTSEEGDNYYFDGFKMVRDDPGLDTWSDTTTLYITVHDGTDSTGPVMGKGILKIRPTDFLRQMTTMKVNNAENLAQSLEANARFGSFFAGVVFSTYARLARDTRKGK